MADHDNDIDALAAFLMRVREGDDPWGDPDRAKDWSRALTALVAERDELQSKVNAHSEDRRQYIEAWAHWIEFKSKLGIEEWLRVYADAVPAPPLDGDEAKRRIYDHLDQRMRDAADTIAALVAERDALKQRVAELESQEFTLPHDPFRDPDRELRERLVCAALAGLNANYIYTDKAADIPAWAVNQADMVLAAMRKGGG